MLSKEQQHGDKQLLVDLRSATDRQAALAAGGQRWWRGCGRRARRRLWRRRQESELRSDGNRDSGADQRGSNGYGLTRRDAWWHLPRRNVACLRYVRPASVGRREPGVLS